jgi:hypothetical protein
MKPMKLSPALAEVLGGKALPRTQVTKKLWTYIKRHKLQDKKNRRMINADAKLKKVFGGRGKVNMFQMTKLVSRHLKRGRGAAICAAHGPSPEGGRIDPVGPVLPALESLRHSAGFEHTLPSTGHTAGGREIRHHSPFQPHTTRAAPARTVVGAPVVSGAFDRLEDAG